MTEERFKMTSELPKGWVDIIDTDNNQTLCNIRIEYANHMVNFLNELDEEKEFWKSDACKETNENNILWNEILIMIEQGAEPSKAFKDYMITKKRGIVNCRFA